MKESLLEQFIMPEEPTLTNNEIRIKDLVALCHIPDFESFQNDLQAYLKEQNQVRTVDRLTDAMDGKRTLLNGPAKRFYQSHKQIMDTINTYTSYYDFVNFNFLYDGSIRKNSSLPYFIAYLRENKDSMAAIVDTLTAIQKLGINRLQLNPKADYTQSIFKLPDIPDLFDSIVYLDHVKYIPNVTGEFLYTTTDSPYKISAEYSNPDRIYFPTIEVTTLAFDRSRLPKSIRKGEITERIRSCKGEFEEKKEQQLRNIAKLNCGFASFDYTIHNFERYLDTLQEVPNLEQFKEKMAAIKAELSGMKEDACTYVDYVEQQYPGIQKTIETEIGNIYYRRKK